MLNIVEFSVDFGRLERGESLSLPAYSARVCANARGELRRRHERGPRRQRARKRRRAEFNSRRRVRCGDPARGATGYALGCLDHYGSSRDTGDPFPRPAATPSEAGADVLMRVECVGRRKGTSPLAGAGAGAELRLIRRACAVLPTIFQVGATLGATHGVR